MSAISFKISSVALLSTLFIASNCYSSDKGQEEPCPYPTINIAVSQGYQPPATELAGTASYQDESWKAAEKLIASNPKLYQQQKAAITEEMTDD